MFGIRLRNKHAYFKTKNPVIRLSVIYTTIWNTKAFTKKWYIVFHSCVATAFKSQTTVINVGRIVVFR